MQTAARLSVLLLSPLVLAQTPPSKAPSPPDRFAEQRAEILRSMADLRAKLQALEVELQILDEQRQAAAQNASAAPPASDWRAPLSPSAPLSSSRSSPEPPAVKPSKARCQALTTQGKRCTRSAEGGSKFCWQHRH